eukprot:COSAG02_NODE_2000_length_10140_cov_14.090429_8_plen_345_part_00
MSAEYETEGLKPQADALATAPQQPPPAVQHGCMAKRRLGCAVLACVGIAAAVAAVILLVFIPRTDPADLPPPCSAGCANFSHALWTDVLSGRLHPASRGVVNYMGFDYEGLRQDQTVFRQYLQQLADADLNSLGVSERKALFINAYNALAVKVLLDMCSDGQLCESIRDISQVWNQPAGQIGGSGEDHLYSLDKIEHDTIRNTQNFPHDARIHAAVNCASVSCPDLYPEAFEAETLDEQLDDAMRLWLANPTKGLAADQPGNALTLSKIFYWYEEDFEAEPGGLLSFVSRHAPSEVGLWLRMPASPDVSYFYYDWNVNGASGSSSAARVEVYAWISVCAALVCA